MPLTRHKSGITILTEAVANSWYGGLFGTAEGALLDPDDPLVAGHIHDGLREDGHAQKIDLCLHTTGQLDGANIKDGTITADKLDPGIVIPTTEDCCALLIVTNDGRLVQDSEGNILLKEEP
jgi:hypothetical protein